MKVDLDWAATMFAITVLILAFAGEPDLMDAIIANLIDAPLVEIPEDDPS